MDRPTSQQADNRLEFVGGIGFFVWCLCKVASDADDAAEADYAAALRGEIE